MTRRVKLETALGKVRPHTLAVFEELAAKYEIHFAWGIGATGDHKAGKALDLMAYERGTGPSHPGPIRKGWTSTVANYVWDNRVRLGVDYVIHDQVIISNNPKGYAWAGPAGSTWHKYPGDSHANHVHVSFEEKPPAYKPPAAAKPPAAKPVKESDAMANATNATAEVLAAVKALDGTVRAEYAAILKNVQQEDPRWRDLTVRLDALQAQVAEAVELLKGKANG